MIKIFASIELVALLIVVVAWGWDVSKRYNYHSRDGGWTTMYNYDGKVRIWAYRLSYLAAFISIVGFFFLIWSL